MALFCCIYLIFVNKRKTVNQNEKIIHIIVIIGNVSRYGAN